MPEVAPAVAAKRRPFRQHVENGRAAGGACPREVARRAGDSPLALQRDAVGDGEIFVVCDRRAAARRRCDEDRGKVERARVGDALRDGRSRAVGGAEVRICRSRARLADVGVRRGARAGRRRTAAGRSGAATRRCGAATRRCSAAAHRCGAAAHRCGSAARRCGTTTGRGTSAARRRSAATGRCGATTRRCRAAARRRRAAARRCRAAAGRRRSTTARCSRAAAIRCRAAGRASAAGIRPSAGAGVARGERRVGAVTRATEHDGCSDCTEPEGSSHGWKCSC